jgi:6-phosphogluconolactonase
MQYERGTRRWFLRAASAVAGGAFLRASEPAEAFVPAAKRRVTDMHDPARCFAYVGSRTTRERNARGDGINVYQHDVESGRWTHLQLISGLANPSYLAFDRIRQFLYAVHGDLSDISAFRIDHDTGKLTFINSASTAGKNPVHLSIDPTNRFIVVANHISSTVVLLARNADGSVGSLADQVTLTGQIGPHRIEQPFSKPHQVELDPSQRFVIVPDKGLDQVFTIRIDAEAGKLSLLDAGTPRSREGSGPRHVAFHPGGTFAYVVGELDSTITAYHFDQSTGKLTPFQDLSTLPDTFVGNSRASEVACTRDGRFLYASNRGHDSIVVFSIDPGNGRLTPRNWTQSQGRTPRFFALDPAGRFVFAANEDSDSIVPFRTDAQSGALAPTGTVVHSGSPVCIVFAMLGGQA